MSIAFLFAGQGSQKKGMGKDLYENYQEFKNIIDKISSMNLGFDLKETMFEDPKDELNKTSITQPCLAAFAAGVLEILKAKGIKASYHMGLSLGEYSALYASNVFSLEEFIKLVSFRGKKMEEASNGIDCKMIAILGLSRDIVEDACKEAKIDGGIVSITNYNCPSQYVITGDSTTTIRAAEIAKSKGAKKCMELKVSGPFHTSFMKPAAAALDEYFSGVEFKEMQTPVIFNCSADLLKENECVKELLVKQVQSSIYVEDSIYKLKSLGVDTTIEIGPGKAISGCVMRTDKSIKTLRIEDLETLNKCLLEIGVN